MIQLIDRVVRGVRQRAGLADPTAAYDRTIRKRKQAFNSLRRDVARLIGMRNKLQLEIHEQRASIARVHHQLRTAARLGADGQALILIDHKNTLHDALAESEANLVELNDDISAAQRELTDISTSLEALGRERRRAAAVIAQQRSRAQVLGAAPNAAEVAALDDAREHVARIEATVRVHRELAAGEPDPLDIDRARLELARLKRQLAA